MQRMCTERDMKPTREKSVTQEDVAERAGVTRSLVSYVLNGTDRSVAPKTREKILQAIAELGYRPNQYAQALLAGKTGLAKNHIGVILHDSSAFLRPYYTEILSGIFTAAHRAGNHIRFVRFFNELENPILFNSLIHEEEISGLIIIGLDQIPQTPENKDITARIKNRIRQVVAVDCRNNDFSSVAFDRREAGYKATAYLQERGYRSIGYIGQMDERAGGFRQAVFEKRPERSTRPLEKGAIDMAGGYNAAAELHGERGGKMPDALCAGSDEIALGVLKFLHDKKIPVPEETAVISIDNLAFSGYIHPALTTVNVQKKQMGEKAVEMITAGQAGSGQNAVTVILPTEIVERESC